MNPYDNESFCPYPGYVPKLRAQDYEMRTEKPLYKRGKDGLYFVVEHRARRTRAGYEARRNGVTAMFVNLADAVNFFNGGTNETDT